MKLPNKDAVKLEEAYKLVKEFNAPEEAHAILDNPDKPTGTLPHSMEAVLDELAHWGQYGHQRVMDPEIAKLAMQLAELIKAKSQGGSKSTREDAASVFKRRGVPRTPGMR